MKRPEPKRRLGAAVTSMGAIEAYRPSGRTNARASAVVVPCGVVVAVLFGGAYQYVIEGMPLLWIGFLVTLGAAIGLAIVARGMAAVAHCRSARMAIGFGVLWGLAAVVGSFLVSYATAVARHRPAGTDILASVGSWSFNGFVDFLGARIDGGWTVGRIGSGRTVSGALVLLVWLVETALLTFAAARGAASAVWSPYCERCGRRAVRGVATDEAVDVTALRRAVRDGDLEAVIAIPRASVRPGIAVYRTRACPRCDAFAWLDVRLLSESELRAGPASILEHSPGGWFRAAFVSALEVLVSRGVPATGAGSDLLLRFAVLSKAQKTRLDDTP